MKRYFVVLNILLITAIVYFCVSAFYRLTAARLDTDHIYKADHKPLPAPAERPIRPLPEYQLIAERNLFKTQKESGRPTDMVDIEKLKPTELKLKLMGTVAGAKEQAYAVIWNDGEKRENLYRIGDTIENAIVQLILREKVVLSVNGKNEILEIEKESFTQSTDSPSPSQSEETGSKNLTLNRNQIDDAVQNINTLMQQVRIRPHFTGGKPDGLSLTGIRPNSLFHNMGLKSGDIITKVDGQSIESVDDALKFYQSLKAASNVKLELKRRGQIETIDYNIK